MNNFTIFTNLPVGKDSAYTPITGKKISELPLGAVYDDSDELVCGVWEYGYFLKSTVVNSQGISAIVVESDTGWCVQFDDADERVRVLESDDGSWKKLRLGNDASSQPLMVLEEYCPYFGHYVYMDQKIKTGGKLRINTQTKVYEFDLASFIDDKVSAVPATIDGLEVVHDVDNTTLIGKRQDLVRGIEYLVEELGCVKDKILSDGH